VALALSNLGDPERITLRVLCGDIDASNQLLTDFLDECWANLFSLLCSL
jgi:hypothetical protein